MPASDESAAAILVRAYGEFWNPDLVNWKRSWELLGIDSQGRTINAYEQRGIYVLYENYAPVYIGKADKQSIGSRLQLHRESQRKGPRWDRFSWFGLKRINKGGHLGALRSNIHVRTSELISTLEAMLILVADPRMNARREALKNAVQLYQSDRGRPLSEAEQQIASIQKKLDSIIELSLAMRARTAKGSRHPK
jgi:hypothetical protein